MAFSYQNLLCKNALQQVISYQQALLEQATCAGNYLQEELSDVLLESLSTEHFLEHLVNTKRPQIFAESAIKGDGSDWNQTELQILGNLSIGMPVTFFDNGLHQAPLVHPHPLTGFLIFSPGALLRNDYAMSPCDWAEVTLDGEFNPEGFYQLYQRRLLPCLHYANEKAQQQNKPTIVTIPGMGCGQFAGPYIGTLGARFADVLHRLLDEHANEFPHIKAVYYDPFNEGNNARYEFKHLSLLVRPLLAGNQRQGQLCHPNVFGDSPEEFGDCVLTSIVAWDHVSWPGNDFFAGARATDDGVKSAASDAMYKLTGIKGLYDKTRHSYQPPTRFRKWEQVVDEYQLRLHVVDNLSIT